MTAADPSTAAPSIVRTPAGAIAYRDLGAGEPILFVHGLLVDGRLWSGVTERLQGDFRCLAPDWPLGSNRMPLDPGADLSPDGMAKTIADFMDAVGIERATVVGNDSGGALAQILAAERPERVERLVLTNCDLLDRFPPFPFSLMPPLVRLPGGMAALTAPFRIGAVGRGVYGMLAKRPIDRGLIASWLEPTLTDPAVRDQTRTFIAGAEKRLTIEAAERLRSFERPVRLAWANEDRFFRVADAERLAAMVPDGRVETVADARTFVALDQPARVAEMIAGFVREGAPAG